MKNYKNIMRRLQFRLALIIIISTSLIYGMLTVDINNTFFNVLSSISIFVLLYAGHLTVTKMRKIYNQNIIDRLIICLESCVNLDKEIKPNDIHLNMPIIKELLTEAKNKTK